MACELAQWLGYLTELDDSEVAAVFGCSDSGGELAGLNEEPAEGAAVFGDHEFDGELAGLDGEARAGHLTKLGDSAIAAVFGGELAGLDGEAQAGRLTELGDSVIAAVFGGELTGLDGEERAGHLTELGDSVIAAVFGGELTGLDGEERAGHLTELDGSASGCRAGGELAELNGEPADRVAVFGDREFSDELAGLDEEARTGYLTEFDSPECAFGELAGLGGESFEFGGELARLAADAGGSPPDDGDELATTPFGLAADAGGGPPDDGDELATTPEGLAGESGGSPPDDGDELATTPEGLAEFNRWTACLKAVLECIKLRNRIPVKDENWVDPHGRCWEVGSWVAAQRKAQNSGTLNARRLAMLSAVPGWRSYSDAWDKWLKVMREYIKTMNRLPTSREMWTAPDGVQWGIGSWTTKQRQLHKRGVLSRACTESLGELPGWKWRMKSELAPRSRWLEWLGKLHGYVRDMGETPRQSAVVMDHDGTRWNVGQWANTQRKAHSKGRLQQDQFDMLAAIPEWEWRRSAARPRAWSCWLEALRECKSAHGMPIARSRCWTRADGSTWEVGRWLSNQMQLSRQGKLSQGNADELAALLGA